MNAPPVLARVLRGGRLESAHRGDVAVVDEDGILIASCGSPRREIFLRSAAKPFQAMPLLEGGGEKEFRLGDDEIALMCASHGGEPRHVRAAARILSRGGFSAADLSCGAHAPMHEPSAKALARSGRRPTPLHNNCSGKHAGLLLACRLYGFDPRGYWEPSHPIAAQVLARVARECGVAPASIGIAVDGCSLPVFHLPLSGLAAGYARLLSGGRPGKGGVSAAARRRVRRAMWASPGMVAGLGRFTTAFLEAGPGVWIGKEGAEGVYAIGIRARRGAEKAIGIAFKMEDGSLRARDAVAVDLLERLGLLAGRAARALGTYRAPVIHNVRGLEVGSIEARVSLERLL